MKVMPTRFWIARNSARMCWRSLRSSADSGSSSSSTFGSTASARATATRCFCPPDNSLIFLSPCPGRATSASSSSALRRRSRLGNAAHAQAVADVLGHRHQREQREVLEDQRGRPLVGADAGHVLAADAHRALRRLEKAGDRAQQRRLAAAGRAENREEFAAVDLQGDVLDGGETAETDRHVVEIDVRAHAPPDVLPRPQPRKNRAKSQAKTLAISNFLLNRDSAPASISRVHRRWRP